MQLVAYGAQDVYLTGEPQITFFKVVYRRHTNFAIESIEQTFTGSTGLGKSVSCIVSRNGDLVSGMHLEVDMPLLTADAADITTANQTVSYVPSVGHALVETAEIEIGGQKIDKHYGIWLELWDELTTTGEKSAGYQEMVGTQPGFKGGKLYVPLQFWFNRNAGLALPLIALQYHEVKVLINFAKVETLLVKEATVAANDVNVGDIVGAAATTDVTNDFNGFNAKLYVDYIYLDTEERRRFAQMSHEYLIDQLQFTGSETISTGSEKVRLNFNHPVKELLWVFQTDTNVGNNDAFNFGADGAAGGDCMNNARLLLNGHDRFSTRPASYFRLVQPYYHHTRIPAKQIYTYSFGLRPEEHQPSGTCNFSRIDNATLFIDTNTNAKSISVFAVNYNVLRIVSGMGGLAYSN